MTMMNDEYDERWIWWMMYDGWWMMNDENEWWMMNDDEYEYDEYNEW